MQNFIADEVVSKVARLDGRVFSSLTLEEIQLFRCIQKGISIISPSVSIISDAPPELLASCRTSFELEAIYYAYRSIIKLGKSGVSNEE